MQCGSGAGYGAGVFRWRAVDMLCKIVPALFCVLVMGMLWASVTIPFCRPGADAEERQWRILSMKAVQDPSACCPAIVSDAVRTGNCSGLL